MTGVEPIWVAGAAALLCALPGMWSRRFGPWVVRLAGLAALAVVFGAALDRPRVEQLERPPRVVAVATGEAAGAVWVERIREVVEDERGGQLVVLDPRDGSDVPTLVGAAALDALDGDASLLLVWNEPFAPGRAATPTPGLGGRTTTPPPPFEPDDVELRPVGAFEVDRPGRLELRAVAGELVELDGSALVTVRGPDGLAALERRFSLAELAQPGRIEWTPASAGSHRVELRVEAEGHVLTGTGAVEVAPPVSVLVVGADAERLAGALRVQGLSVTAEPALPAELLVRSIVVALDPIPAQDQERVLAFVDQGGGLLLAGGEAGGALPWPNEPLAQLLPFERMPAPEAPEREPGAGEGTVERPDDPVEPDRDAAPPKPPPGDPGETPPPKEREDPIEKPPEGAIRGDTSQATDPSLTEREVERRSIALVLVIDRSGSMSNIVRGGATKMDFAKRSAFETAARLEDGDELGIVAFGERDYPVLELGPAPSEAELRANIERLRAADHRTLLARALDRAGNWLRESEAPVRHAVVITDGDLPDVGDRAACRALAQRIGDDGITVSLIQIISALPTGEVREIADIARRGRGRFVRTEDASSIPTLMFAEVQRVLGTAGRRPGGGGGPEPDARPAGDPTKPPEPDPPPPPEPDPKPEPDPEPEPEPEADAPVELRVIAVADSVLLEPQPDDGFPSLGGVWPVAGRPNAHVLLAVEDGTPLLAFGHFGLGRVGAFAAGFTGPWTTRWRDDPAFPGRLGAWVSHLRAPEASPRDADVLDARQLEPAAPLRDERAYLAGFGADPLEPIAAYEPPPVRTVEVRRGRAVDDALLALLALCSLALIEFFVRRSG